MNKLIALSIAALALGAVVIAFLVQTPPARVITQDSSFTLLKPTPVPQATLKTTVFASKLNGPRDIQWDSLNSILVSIPEEGKVVALMDENHDGQAEKTYTVLSGLNRPHGLEMAENILYVAETDGVSMYAYDAVTKTARFVKEIITLPAGGRHWTRSLLIYNSQLFTSIGSSCDVCIESDEHRASIWISNLDGEHFRPFATGLRNSVFMALNPKTRRIWATEMGRDNLGDNLPPDEINIISLGRNYGWPICYGKNVQDTRFRSGENPCQEPNYYPSLVDIPAHSAPLGLAFIPQSWPSQYRNHVLVALHGSWNRSTPIGYKVAMYPLVGEGVGEQQDFLTTWPDASGSSKIRPVDLEFDPNGTLYISDDENGVIIQVKPNSN